MRAGQSKSTSTAIHKIRPSARLVKTIGEDLIKDTYAAVVELVKNAYDADSPDTTVVFEYDQTRRRLTITVTDHGHGMSSEDVVDRWLVPATADKLHRKQSPKGRPLQGRKGIGRFAAAVLGEQVFLETTKSGSTTSLLLDMSQFTENRFLEDVEILVEKRDTGKPDGTSIEIATDDISAEEVRDVWTNRQLDRLFLELKKLLSPSHVDRVAGALGYLDEADDFSIFLNFADFPVDRYSQQSFKVEPFPVVDLFDYRIHGVIDEFGNAELTYENQNLAAIPPEPIRKHLLLSDPLTQRYCGRIALDLRVYDRDPESIDSMIRRGLRDPITGEYVGRREARKILDEFYGVGVYRGKFRVRPYGDQDFDWLDLDKKRVQNPSFRIGHNQVIGFVYIQPEERSNLKEKSARDGLVENKYYFGLRSLVGDVARLLEERRLDYRRKAFRGRRPEPVEKALDNLVNFSGVESKIQRGVASLGISITQSRKVTEVVSTALDEERRSKEKELERIRETIAMYQGQVTLGKITHVLLHEGRKHIKYLLEATPRLTKWAQDLKRGFDPDVYARLSDRSEKVVENAKSLSYLFKRIEPLAVTRRPRKAYHSLWAVANDATQVFESELRTQKIEVRNLLSKRFAVEASSVDLFTIFTNLFENSVYWMSLVEREGKWIRVSGAPDDRAFVVEIEDSGPGFQGDNVDLMFEPGYSMKPDGTGLGLSLTGDAMSRIGGEISAKKTSGGALFELRFSSYKEVR